MRAERNPVFVIRRMVFACARKDMVALDVISASLDIMVIPTVYHVTAVLSAHQASVVILWASAHASPISPEGLAVNVVQDITNIRNASVIYAKILIILSLQVF